MLLCVNAPDLPRALWEELLDALDAVSPLVDDVRPGLAFLDMRGIEGTPPQWMARTRAILAPLHFRLRLGAGSNKIAARAAAHVTDGSVCAKGRERALLAPLPLALLDVDRDTTERLRLLGIDRLGDLARLPHGPFVRRFGSQAARWHALANGIDRTPFVPRGHAAAIEAAIFGEGRADDEAQVIFALRMLLARIAADLEQCGKRAGALALDIELEDAHTHRFEIPLAAPTAQERAMLDVVRAKLEGVTFPAPIVGLRVRAGALEEGGEALPLITGDDFDPQTVAVTIARLEAALGATIQRAHTRPSHILEERYQYNRFTPPERTHTSYQERNPSAQAEPNPSCHAERSSRTASAVEAPLEAPLVPQLRLLAVTEIPVQIRHGEPAFIGDPLQAVLECAGPWRIDLDGFPGEPVERDEYDVVLEDGRRCRIYHQGPHWYLRGLYD